MLQASRSQTTVGLEMEDNADDDNSQLNILRCCPTERLLLGMLWGLEREIVTEIMVEMRYNYPIRARIFRQGRGVPKGAKAHKEINKGIVTPPSKHPGNVIRQRGGCSSVEESSPCDNKRHRKREAVKR